MPCVVCPSFSGLLPSHVRVSCEMIMAILVTWRIHIIPVLVHVYIILHLKPGGHSLLQPCTMRVLIKNNRPPTADWMYWIPPSIADRYKIYPPPIAEQGTRFCRYTKMFKDRTGKLLSNWILERCTNRSGYRGWAGRTLEKMHSLYIKYLQKSKYWGPIAGTCLFRGAYLFPRGPTFLRQKTTP
jgi:hypothetical protein